MNMDYILLGLDIKFFDKVNIKKKNIICFLPGSREVEIMKNLSKMNKILNDISSEYPNFKFYILRL